MNLNKCFILGRAGEDPVLKSLSTNMSVTSFSVATNRNWTDKEGNKHEETEWHRVVVWGKLAEVASSFITKGSVVMIEGRLQTRKWKTKEGVDKSSTEIVAENIQFGSKPQSTPQQNDIPIVNIDEEIDPQTLPF
jgi:single-strand DNA-binding protein